jgi:hypothetical protein
VQGLVRIAPYIMRVRGNYADQELAGIDQSKIPKGLALSWYTNKWLYMDLLKLGQ